MGIDFPSSLSASAGQKFTYSGQEYEFNGTAWKKSRDKVVSFNGATGAIIGVTSVQGKTGDVTLTDLEITHGVETFNGLSGSIDTTSLILPVAGLSASGGITFSDGTFQPTAARSGFRYTMVSSGSGMGTPSSGHMDIDKAGEVDTLSINHTDKEGNNLKPLFQKLRDNGGYLELMTGDFSQAAVIAIESQSGDDEIITSGETTIAVYSSSSTIQAEFDIEQGLDQVSITDVYLRIFPNAANFIREFNGITGSVDTTSLVLPVTGLSASGGITLSGDISIAGDIIAQDNNVAIKNTTGELMISFLGSQTIINNSAVNQDIIVKGNGDSQLFVTDAGNNRVGIGTNTPTEKLDVDGVIKASGITLAGGITFADGTQQKTATKDVGTFTISASSAISTGAKTDALHRIPYNATLTKFELKSKATGGMTAAVYISGGDFGNPTTGFVTGATAETTGLTGETTTFGTASVNEGDFVYLHVLANASGTTAAQAFVSYETRA